MHVLADHIAIPIPHTFPDSAGLLLRSRPLRRAGYRPTQLNLRTAPPLVLMQGESVARHRPPRTDPKCAPDADSLLPLMFGVALLQFIVSCATAVYAIRR